MTNSLFDRVLFPIVDAENAETTCESIKPYVEAHANELVAVYVVETDDALLETTTDDSTEEADDDREAEVFEAVRTRFDDLTVPIQTEVRRAADVVEAIFEAADDLGATVIGVTPRSDDTLVGLLSGDDAHELVDQTDVPVVVFPPTDRRKPFRGEDTDYPHVRDDVTSEVLVPIDGSDLSLKAVEHACWDHSDAEIVLLHVLESRGASVYESMTGGPSSDAADFEKRREREVERLFQEAASVAAEYDVQPSTLTLTGNVADAIITCADQRDVDQIVMGSRGRSGITKTILGSVSETVIQGSSVPVTIVR